jgi:hypothetical protein
VFVNGKLLQVSLIFVGEDIHKLGIRAGSFNTQVDGLARDKHYSLFGFFLSVVTKVVTLITGSMLEKIFVTHVASK